MQTHALRSGVGTSNDHLTEHSQVLISVFNSHWNYFSVAAARRKIPLNNIAPKTTPDRTLISLSKMSLTAVG